MVGVVDDVEALCQPSFNRYQELRSSILLIMRIMINSHSNTANIYIYIYICNIYIYVYMTPGSCYSMQHPKDFLNMEKYGFNMDSGIWIHKGCKHAMCPVLRQLEELGRLAQGQ